MIQMQPMPVDRLNRANWMWDPSGDQPGQRAAILAGWWVKWVSAVPSVFTA